VEKAALVTGGSSGIGLAIARMLRGERFQLTVASRTRAKIDAAAAELGAHGVAADVSREEDCVRLVREHGERWGRLDLLVNSAGVGIAGRIDELATKSLDLQLAVNLRGLMLVTREALPLLRASRGLVVNLASVAGTAPAPELPVYGAVKAGVIAFTRSLNAAEEEHGVRATALSPAFVDTPMASYAGLDADEMIRPEDCAEIVRMLLRLGPRARLPQIVVERLGAGAPGPACCA
jgi:NAD(P)-dependent dehydrogenase (short-subunit alcohol dehydrogenase family)